MSDKIVSNGVGRPSDRESKINPGYCPGSERGTDAPASSKIKRFIRDKIEAVKSIKRILTGDIC